MKTNRTISGLLLLAFFISSCTEVSRKKYILRISGSESMHETFDALKTDFENRQDTLQVIISGGGSKTGLTAIKNGEAEIGLSSFPFDPEIYFGTDHQIRQHIVAYDGIVLITNQHNPVSRLTDDEISAIYSGEITNWQQLGGLPGQIIPIIRDQNSGTQTFFRDYFHIEKITETALVAKENAEIVNKVKNLEAAIGFIGFAYFTESVNNLLLRSQTDSTFIPPAFRYVHNGAYPLKRSLQIYYQADPPLTVRSFLKYLDSPTAQTIMEMHGLIPVSKMQ